MKRSDAIKTLVILPALAATFSASVPAEAADNKKQFHYQDKPGKNGQKCSGCRFFKAPSACSIVTGKISPNGWCIAWAKK
jgi:High potential iron-sulfur protein